jgi:hypothetical protein
MGVQEELDELDRDRNPHRRGRRFETFLAHLLEQEGFRVTRNPGTALPRQTDLFAQNEQVSFLVEAKWTKKRMGVEGISEVRDRLGRVTRDVFACVFSVAGFAEAALEDVHQRRSLEIYLFNGIEIRGIADGRISFHELLAEKRNWLRSHGVVFLCEAVPETTRSQLRSEADVFQIGTENSKWMKNFTGHNDIVFSNELLDCTGYSSDSVFSLQLRLDLDSIRDLQRTLRVIKNQISLSGQGSFSIHQGGVGWFGFGFESFLVAVKNQKDRYNELGWESYHHSEELAYLDRLESGGLMCLTSRQGTGPGNYLHSSRVEIYSPGIPIDMSNVRRLCAITKNEGTRLESVGRDPVETIHFRQGIEIEPVATIVTNWSGERIASGLVVRNPFLNHAIPTDEDASINHSTQLVSKSEFLFCALRNWHGSDVRMRRYELRSIDSCWIAHFCAFHLMCDWLD